MVIILFYNYVILALKRLLVYRIKIISEFLSSFILPVVLNFFLWGSILSQNVIKYSFNEIMIYIIISNLIFSFTQIHAEIELEEDIKSHKLGHRLLRPINYILDVVLRYLTDSLCKFCILYAPVICVTLVFGKVKINFNQIILFVISLILAFLLNAALSFVIGFLSFWLTEIWGVSAIRNILLGLLSGTVFPLDIFSSMIQDKFIYLPFPYMAYMPTKIISEPNLDFYFIYKGYSISILWIVLLVIIAYILFKIGIRQYTLKGV